MKANDGAVEFFGARDYESTLSDRPLNRVADFVCGVFGGTILICFTSQATNLIINSIQIRVVGVDDLLHGFDGKLVVADRLEAS